MSHHLEVFLNTSPEQAERLSRLQAEFAAACNLVAPLAQANRCWNRVALHHLAYRDLRARYPQLGSQMACNAIYSVARTYRILLQHPKSPCNIEQHPNRPLPLLQFQEKNPVYFDRHTLSIKGSQLSMFSLDGRLHFQLKLEECDAGRFAHERLREIALRRVGKRFALQFWLADKAALLENELQAELPDYVVLLSPSPQRPNQSVTIASALASLPL